MTTPLVAFIDSDCTADPGWITQLAAHFADPLVGAVAPRVRPMTGRGAVGRYLDARAPIDMGGSEARVRAADPAGLLPTAALLVRRAAAGTRVDPDLRYGEDVDLIWRMIAAGWRVRYDRRPRCCTPSPAGGGGCWPAGSGTAARPRRCPAGIPGLVPPLVLQETSPAAVAAGLLARRPVIALAAYAVGTGQLARLLRGWGIPARDVPGPMAASVLHTWLGAGRWSAQYALPAGRCRALPGPVGGPAASQAAAARRAASRGAAARPAASRGAAAGLLRLALVALLAGTPAAAWVRGRPRLDPVRFTLAYLADEAAVRAGV